MFAQSCNGNVWYLFNEVYNAPIGIRAGCASGDAAHCRNQCAIGNIIYNATNTGIIIKAMGTAESHAYFNTVYNAGTDIFNEGGITYIENNIDSSYPASTFVDAVNNDFHLRDGSPAIGAGVFSSKMQEVFDLYESLYGVSIRFDFDGNPKLLDGDNNGSAEWDIGAYEYIEAGAGAAALSPFTKLWNWLKSLLTRETGKAITGNVVDGDLNASDENFFLRIINFVRDLF